MKYAVIDISSSNTSMIVAEVNDRITEVIFRDRTSLTLQHYMEGRKLSSRGIDKVVESVQAMKDKCVSLGADVLYVISTAALRRLMAAASFGRRNAAVYRKRQRGTSSGARLGGPYLPEHP